MEESQERQAAMSREWSSDWYNDGFSDDDFHYAPCRHRHVVPVTIGRRRFIEGEVTDDIRILFQCTACLEYVSEPEVRSAWNGQSIKEGSTSQLGDDFEEDPVSDREEVKE